MADIKLLKEMGERIFERRRMLKMTQEELAEKIGVSTQMISNLETGKKAIRPENLLKVCKGLNISADYVLTGKNFDNMVDGVVEELANLNPNELKMVKDMIEYMNSKK